MMRLPFKMSRNVGPHRHRNGRGATGNAEKNWIAFREPLGNNAEISWRWQWYKQISGSSVYRTLGERGVSPWHTYCFEINGAGMISRG